MTEQLEGQMSLFDVDGWFGKTYPAHCPQTTAKTLESSSKRRQESQIPMPLFLDLTENGSQPEASWERGILSHGAFTTPVGGEFRSADGEYACLLTSTALQPLGYYLTANWSEHPRRDIVTKLSQVLEANPEEKYRLSEMACKGILRRAETRGKGLPQELKEALERQAGQSKLGGGCEVDSRGKKAGKGALVQVEKAGTIAASQDQTLVTRKGVDVYNGKIDGDITCCVTAATGIANASGAKVMCGGFKTRESAKARSQGYETEMAPTVDADGNQSVLTALAFDVRNSNVSETNGSIQSSAKHNVNSNNIVWDVEGK